MVSGISQSAADFIRDAGAKLGGDFDRIHSIRVDDKTGAIHWSAPGKAARSVTRLSAEQRQQNLGSVKSALALSGRIQQRELSADSQEAQALRSLQNRVVTALSNETFSRAAGRKLVSDLTHTTTAVPAHESEVLSETRARLDIVAQAVAAISPHAQGFEGASQVGRSTESIARKLTDGARDPALTLSAARRLLSGVGDALQSIQQTHLPTLSPSEVAGPDQLEFESRLVRASELAQANVEHLQTLIAKEASTSPKAELNSAAHTRSETPLPPEIEQGTGQTTSVTQASTNVDPNAFQRQQVTLPGGNVQLVSRQVGDCCFGHAAEAYFNQPLFENADDFLTKRNQLARKEFNEKLGGEETGLADLLLEEQKAIQLTQVETANAVLNRLVTDQEVNAGGDGFVFHTLTIDRQRENWEIRSPEGRERASVLNREAVNSFLADVSQNSSSNRFLIRTGGLSGGHFQTLVKHDDGTWTSINSTGGQVTSGASPYDTFESDPQRRELVLAVITQSPLDEDTFKSRVQRPVQR